MHFQGYIADSLRSAKGKKTISDIITKVLFEQNKVRFKSYFTERVQFDSNSCGVWLIAALAAYVHSLSKSSVRNYAFDITFSLFERKKEFRDENVQSEVPSSEKLEK